MKGLITNDSQRLMWSDPKLQLQTDPEYKKYNILTNHNNKPVHIAKGKI